MVYLTFAVIGLGGRGEIIHELKRQPAVPSHASVRSDLSGSSEIQPLAAREENWHLCSFFLFVANSWPTSLPTVEVSFTHAILSLPTQVCQIKIKLKLVLTKQTKTYRVA